MAELSGYYFLRYADRALIKANEYLGRGPHQPNGGVDPDAIDQEVSNHAAIVDLTERLEHFSTWATELSTRLESAGVVELLREEP